LGCEPALSPKMKMAGYNPKPHNHCRGVAPSRKIVRGKVTKACGGGGRTSLAKKTETKGKNKSE